MVPNVTIVADSIMVNGNIVALTLSWGEPFNNLDPIVNYIISCSSVRCLLNFTVKTTDNATRNYTITDLSPKTHYEFSVAAVNSVGKGKTGVVMITTPGRITLHIVSYVAPVDITTCVCRYTVRTYLIPCSYIRTYVRLTLNLLL